MMYLDAGSILVAAITLVLFVAALFVKGLTHDMLLESAVFLISIKLVMMVYKNNITSARLESKLDAILSELKNGK